MEQSLGAQFLNYCFGTRAYTQDNQNPSSNNRNFTWSGRASGARNREKWDLFQVTYFGGDEGDHPWAFRDAVELPELLQVQRQLFRHCTRDSPDSAEAALGGCREMEGLNRWGDQWGDEDTRNLWWPHRSIGLGSFCLIGLKRDTHGL